MEREPRRRDAEALDRYWDAVLSEDPSGASAEVGEAQDELIGRLKALGTTPGREEAQARIWAHLTLQMRHDRDEQLAEMTAVLPPVSTLIGANGRVEGLPAHDPPLRFPPQRHHWMVTQFATAALLALTLIAGLVAFGPWRPGWRESSPAQLLPAIAVATPEPIPDPVVEFLWQADGKPDALLGMPAGAAVDEQGNLWVTDGTNGRLVIFSPDGAVLETWGARGGGEGEFDFKCGGEGYGGVAFDPAGNIYVADAGNGRIQKFGPDRAYLTSWPIDVIVDSQLLATGRGNQGAASGPRHCPAALALDGQGRIYVRERNTGTIQVFDSDGRSVATVIAEQMRPEGVDLDSDGNIWVADNAGRILKFSSDGTLLAEWDRYGTGEGELQTPMGIAVDADGRVFVSDQGNRVQVFAPDGAFLGSWGSAGFEPGQFIDPVGLALDGDSHIYVVEHYGSRVQKFRLLPPLGPG